MFCGLVSLIAGGTLACGAGGGSPAGDLARRLESAEDPQRYSLDYQSALGDVLDCAVSSPQSFSADVDLTTGVMEVRSAHREDGPTVVVVDDAAWLHRSLFAVGTVPAEWLVVDGGAPATARRRLVEVIGTALGEYAQPGAFAPSGNAFVVSALDVAQNVRSQGSDRVDGDALDRYEITVDSERLAEAVASAAPAAADEAPTQQVTPVIGALVDADGLVGQITVTGVDAGSGADETASGWTVDYGYGQASLDRPAEPNDRVGLADIDVEDLAMAPPEPCQLGG